MAGRSGDDIRIRGAGEGSELPAYLSVPASGRGPGVVVVQEWWGLVDSIRDVCDRLAREGFVALAPDLYRGEATSDPEVAQRLMLALEIPRATDDLGAAVGALLDHDSVDGARLGCIGFCMGGQLALHAATRHPRIAAVVDCYGIHPAVELDLERLGAAVLGVFAEDDAFVPEEAVRKLAADLERADVRAHVEVYAGVQHGFLNEERAEVYDAVRAAEAWRDILSFLRAELG